MMISRRRPIRVNELLRCDAHWGDEGLTFIRTPDLNPTLDEQHSLSPRIGERGISDKPVSSGNDIHRLEENRSQQELMMYNDWQALETIERDCAVLSAHGWQL